jgi:3-oxoacyl-[acyl-carrier protein] reductase
VAKTIRSTGGDAEFALADLRSLDDLEGLIRQVGRLDVLVNNAASCFVGPATELSAADFDDMFYTNVRAPFLLTTGLLSKLRDRRGQRHQHQLHRGQGRDAGDVAVRRHQGAVESLTRSLAVEYATAKVRVNAIAPGTISRAAV